MSKRTSPQLRIALVAAALWTLAGCAGLGAREPVQVYVVGVEPLQGEGLELRMLVKLRVQNPNDTPIDYSGVSISMGVQGRTFASGVSNEAGTVPRFGERVIELPVSISALRAIRSAAGIAQTNPEKIDYELKGKLAGPLLKSVRFTSKGEIALPKDVYRRAD
ncbi:MAG TPA: LEA type 2 family protein [Steroidobacteraceae bacterium]